jgi:choline-sulfatase
VVADAVSLVDIFPTVLESVGIAADPTKPGRSLFAEPDPQRVVLSEYHAVGAPSGAFMIRKGRWKYNYYVGYRPELFDLKADPEEVCDRANEPIYAAPLRELHADLLAICDPDAVDRRAKADQAALVAKFGGRDAALQFGNSEATPAPITSS